MQNEVLTFQFVRKIYLLILSIIMLCLNCSAAMHFLVLKMCSQDCVLHCVPPKKCLGL